MRRVFWFLIFVTTIFIFYSCNRNNVCQSGESKGQITIFKFSDFYSTHNLADSLDIRFHLIDDERKEIQLIITNQQDYQNNIRCDSDLPDINYDTLPSLDFSRYEILAGRFPTVFPGYVKQSELKFDCGVKKYFFNVNIWAKGGSPALDYVDYFAVILKPDNSYPIIFKVITY